MKTKLFPCLVSVLVVGGVGGVSLLLADGIMGTGHPESRLLIFVGLCLIGLTNGSWK